MSWLEDRTIATLIGAAVGDALGGAIEGWTPEQIAERHGGPVTGIVGPFYENWETARPIAPYHKGDGHITDDTLMTHALIQVYEETSKHLDAYDIASHLVPILIGQPRWIPELEKETIILHRIFLAEKWIVAKLHYGHQDPREAGVGNIVNCGAAMYMSPVGIVNAGDHRAAYLEAIDIAGTHQWSYGREGAGVYAATVAAALAPGATAQSVIDASLDVAHDGTLAAIRAIISAVEQARADDVIDDQPELGRRLRDAIRPFDLVGEDYRNPSMDARRPSRTKSIEELPVALGFVLAHDGAFVPAVLGSTNYGRDADSIATMAGSICAALQGIDSIPQDWVTTIETNSKIDLTAVGKSMAKAAQKIMTADARRVAARLQTLGEFGLVAKVDA